MAPQPQSNQQPAFMSQQLPFMNHQSPYTNQHSMQPYFQYGLPLQHGQHYPPPPHVMYGYQSPYLHYGPPYPHTMPPNGFPPPSYSIPGNYQPLQHTPFQPTALIPSPAHQTTQYHGTPLHDHATPHTNHRPSLPPATRQATQSVWASTKRGRTFNVAEWAQENRPTTPQVSATTSHTAINPQPSASVNSANARYASGHDSMYPRTVGGASQQLRDLTGGGEPTFAQLTDVATFPFEEPARGGGPAASGVVRIGNVSTS